MQISLKWRRWRYLSRRLTAILCIFSMVCTSSYGIDFITNDEELLNSVATVNGLVSNEQGDPLIGASVLVKGTTQGALTDNDGKFTLEVDDLSSTLVISYIGYETQEVPINNQTYVEIVMTVSETSLDEVVVTGYGTQIRRDLTGSIGSVNIEDFEGVPITTTDQVLGGRVAGVHIANRSGDPGAPINVRIRGVGTPGNNQPLWVIDGVPIVQTSNITVNTGSSTETNPLAGLNPNDIESIDVLKDASAAAIYGARAANGVILVTTKRGKAGTAKADYTGYVGVATVPENRWFDVLDVEEYIDIQTELGRDVSQFRGSDFVDWQDFVFRNALRQDHNINVSGGSENATYSIGANYTNQEGTERSQEFERYSIRANSDLNIGKRLKFGESLTIARWNRLVQSESGRFAARSGALNAPYYEIFGNGPFGYNFEGPSVAGQGRGSQGPALRTDLRDNETRIVSWKILGSVYGEIEILPGLKFRTTGGVDYNVGDGFWFQNNANPSDAPNAVPGTDLLVESRPIELTTNWSNTLTYNTLFGNNKLTLLLGHEETNFEFKKIRLQGRDLFNKNIRFASTGSAVAAGNEADHWALRGFLARVNYSYNDRYLFTFNVRRDATSRFAEDNRADYFPSVSVGWRLSDEPFMSGISFIDDFKLRAGWGQSGNQFTGQNFAYLTSLQTTIFYVVGESQNVARGPAPITFANPNLIWETSTQLDIGVDISMLGGKLDVIFDYYQKVTEDVLLPLPIPASSGFFLPADANLGEIKNNGIELAIDYRNQIGDFFYSIGGNITTVNNEVTSLGDIAAIISGVGGGQTHRTIEGEAMGHFFGYKTDGLYQTTQEAEGAVPDALSGGAEAGDIRFQDVNGDGVVDANDRTIIGSPIPGFYYGATLMGRYKGLDLSIFLQGVGDVQVYNAGRIAFENMTGNNNFFKTVQDRWTGPGTSNSMPRLSRTDPNANNRFSDRWVEDAGYLRIKNIQLGYTMPSKILQGLTSGFISRFRVYLGVQNLYTFTNYTGFDPEVTRGFSFQKGEFPLATGQDSGSTPQPQIWQVGWQITF